MRSAGKEGGEAVHATAGGPATHVDIASVMKPPPELIAKGKPLFAVNCASCHGNQGFGDGPAAAALNPKPRNFHEGYWKYGGGIARVVQTISTGSPGTAMAGFTNIPLEDRFAIAQYERSLEPKLEEDKPADLAWLGPIGGGGGGATGGGGGGAPGGGATGGPAGPGPSIPIELALRLMQEPAATTPLSGQAPPSPDTPGGALYGQRCASCHGAQGEGGIRVRMLGSAPYAYVTTLPLSSSKAWGDAARFEKVILGGIPGYVMPGNGDLSRDEIRQLYDFTSSLRARQPAAAPSGGPAASLAPNDTRPAPVSGNRS